MAENLLCFDLKFRNLSIQNNIDNLSDKDKSVLEINEIIDFIKLHITRGICST